MPSFLKYNKYHIIVFNFRSFRAGLWIYIFRHIVTLVSKGHTPQLRPFNTKVITLPIKETLFFTYRAFLPSHLSFLILLPMDCCFSVLTTPHHGFWYHLQHADPDNPDGLPSCSTDQGSSHRWITDRHRNAGWALARRWLTAAQRFWGTDHTGNTPDPGESSGADPGTRKDNRSRLISRSEHSFT